MERLTDRTRNYDGTAVSKKSLIIEHGMRKGTPSAYCYAIVTKLADYEDAEEQGLLLRLPCKVGDTVYHTVISPDKPEIIPFKISGIKVFISEDGSFKFDLYGDTFPSLRGDILGERVFFTKEEAEQALKKMGEREDEKD